MFVSLVVRQTISFDRHQALFGKLFPGRAKLLLSLRDERSAGSAGASPSRKIIYQTLPSSFPFLSILYLPT